MMTKTMKAQQRGIMILVTLTISGCFLSAPSAPGGPTPPAGTIDDPLAVAIDCDSGLPDDAFTLQEAEVVGDLLRMSVWFSGGCSDHEFAVCWNGAFLESFPVQAHLQVVHNANGDNCEAALTRELYVDLTALREGYGQAYADDQGTIIVGIDGQKSVDYQF